MLVNQNNKDLNQLKRENSFPTKAALSTLLWGRNLSWNLGVTLLEASAGTQLGFALSRAPNDPRNATIIAISVASYILLQVGTISMMQKFPTSRETLPGAAASVVVMVMTIMMMGSSSFFTSSPLAPLSTHQCQYAILLALSALVSPAWRSLGVPGSSIGFATVTNVTFNTVFLVVLCLWYWKSNTVNDFKVPASLSLSLALVLYFTMTVISHNSHHNHGNETHNHNGIDVAQNSIKRKREKSIESVDGEDELRNTIYHSLMPSTTEISPLSSVPPSEAISRADKDSVLSLASVSNVQISYGSFNLAIRDDDNEDDLDDYEIKVVSSLSSSPVLQPSSAVISGSASVASLTSLASTEPAPTSAPAPVSSPPFILSPSVHILLKSLFMILLPVLLSPTLLLHIVLVQIELQSLEVMFLWWGKRITKHLLLLLLLGAFVVVSALELLTSRLLCMPKTLNTLEIVAITFSLVIYLSLSSLSLLPQKQPQQQDQPSLGAEIQAASSASPPVKPTITTAVLAIWIELVSKVGLGRVAGLVGGGMLCMVGTTLCGLYIPTALEGIIEIAQDAATKREQLTHAVFLLLAVIVGESMSQYLSSCAFRISGAKLVVLIREKAYHSLLYSPDCESLRTTQTPASLIAQISQSEWVENIVETLSNLLLHGLHILGCLAIILTKYSGSSNPDSSSAQASSGTLGLNLVIVISTCVLIAVVIPFNRFVGNITRLFITAKADLTDTAQHGLKNMRNDTKHDNWNERGSDWMCVVVSSPSMDNLGVNEQKQQTQQTQEQTQPQQPQPDLPSIWEKFAKRSDVLYKVNVRKITVNSGYEVVVTFISRAGLALAMWQGSLLVLNGSLTGGELLSLFLYATIFFDQLWALFLNAEQLASSANILKYLGGLMQGQLITDCELPESE